MAVVTQEIGIPIDLTKGSFSNTTVINNTLQLKEIRKDDNGVSIYPKQGSWESEAINIKDKIAAFKNIVRTSTVKGSGSYKLYTSTSADGYNWSEYSEVTQDGSIKSEVNNYAKIKVELLAANSMVSLTVDDFTDADKYKNEYIESSNGSLKLKKQYPLQAQQNSDWTNGKLFTARVPNSKFKRIDSIRLVKGV